MSEDYTNKIEVVVTVLITNKENKILLIKSHKWRDVYLMPGGHVENSETLAEAARREGEEETGLQLEVMRCLSAGELINDPAYRRKAHFVYFYFLCRAVSEEVILDQKELDDYIWIDPQKALSLPLATGVKKVIDNYIKDEKIGIISDRFIFEGKDS